MIDKQTVIDKLSTFRNRDKFSTSAWKARGLNPSSSEICNKLQALFNDCASNLIEAINSDSKHVELKSILKKWLNSINVSEYDTEEREFICDYFGELSAIVSVDFTGDLNNWLYGRVLSTLFKAITFFRGKEKIVETLTQDCTKCSSKLETFILRKEKGIPDYNWIIIQCNNCNEFNLLSIGADVKQLRFGNYKSIEQLSKLKYTEEQAIVRLEQIKFFRT